MSTKSLNRTRSAVHACLRRASLNEAKAYDQGANAARCGLSCDLNPHPELSALWRAWNMGWKENA